MKVRFYRSEAAIWATEKAQRAMWNPETIAPGVEFRLTDSGKWVRTGSGPADPRAHADVVKAWNQYLASLIVD